MANINTPFGLQPMQRLDGAKWTGALRVYFVPAANTNALYIGDPVLKTAGTADTQGVAGVDIAAAGTGNKITGVVCGFVGACAAGTANPSFFGLSATPGPAYRPATTALDYYILVNDDPETMYYIQENDAGAPLTVATVGKNANLVAGTGSAYTGNSGWQLNVTGTGTGATLQLRIIGFAPGPINVAGSAYAKVIVQINTHTELPNVAGI